MNGSVFSVVTTPVSTRLNDGSVWWAWVDYDGSLLELRLSQTPTRPAAPMLSHSISLTTVLGMSQAYVGFTSGTGAAFGNHDVLSWQFDNSFSPFGAAVDVPTVSPAMLVLIALALAAVGTLVLRFRQRG